MDLVPVAALLLSTASAVAFLLVGRTVRRRQVSHEARLAQGAFVTWWYALAAVSAIGVALAVPGFPLRLDVFLVVTVVALFLLCVALCGLLLYLVYLFTARRDLLAPLAAAYVAYFAFLVYFIVRSGPMAVEATRWGPQLEYATPVEGGPLYWTAVLLLVGPQIAGALGYLSLYRKVDNPLQRRRVLLVSLSILGWFSSSFVSTSPGAMESDLWQMASRLIGLAAAGTIYYAYAGLRPNEPNATAAQPGPAQGFPYEGPPKGRAAHALPPAA